MVREKNKLLLSIGVVVLIVLLVFGATFAYWRWASEDNTVVKFTVAGGMMTIDGGGNISSVSKLAPAKCTNSKYAIQRKIKVTATNETNKDMTEVLKLKVNQLSVKQGTLNSENKKAIEWMLVRASQSQYNATSWLQASDLCSASANTNVSLLETNGTVLSRGNFSQVSTGGEIVLYNGDKVSVGETANDYFELYIWISPLYEGSISTGTSIRDALQDLTINLSWQGTLTNDPEA